MTQNWTQPSMTPPVSPGGDHWSRQHPQVLDNPPLKSSSHIFHIWLAPYTQTTHLSTGSNATTVQPQKLWHGYYDNIPPLPLLSNTSLQAQTGRWGRRRSIYAHLHTHTQTSMPWKSFFDADAKRPVHWKPPILLMRWLSDPGVWWERSQDTPTPPTQSHDAINHDHNQGQRIHVSDLFITWLQLFRLVTR